MVTPLGDCPSEVLRRIQAGESAAAPPTTFDASGFACPVCAKVQHFEPSSCVSEAKLVRLMSREAQLAVAAARLALRDADVTSGSTYPPEQIGLYGATGLAGLPVREITPLVRVSTDANGQFDLARFGHAGLRAVSPLLSFKILSNMPLCFVSINDNIQGSNAIYTPWEGGGAQAIETGTRALCAGAVRCAVVGGCDVKTHELAFATLQQQGLFSSWLQIGKGIVPGEGAAFLVLETVQDALARGARYYGCLSALSLRPQCSKEDLAQMRVKILKCLNIRATEILVSAANDDEGWDQQEMSLLECANISVPRRICPKKCVGDLFAAAAPLQLALAAALTGSGVASVLAHCLGHGSTQAAFVLVKQPGGGQGAGRARGMKSGSNEPAEMPAVPDKATELPFVPLPADTPVVPAPTTLPAKRRVVVTGLGVCTGVGRGVPAFWQGLTGGRSGISLVTVFDASALPVRIGGQVQDLNPGQWLSTFPEVRGERDRKLWLGLDAATQAIREAGLEADALSEALLVIGVSLETFFLSDVAPLASADNPTSALRAIINNLNATHLQTPLDRLADILGHRYRFRGGRYTNCSACAAGAQAIGEAFWRIRDGQTEVALAGASDSVLNPLAMGGFSLLQILSTENETPEKACRPFDATRRGTVLGEGAAFLVLETLERANARGARVYAEVLGYGASLDAYRVTDPEPDGKGAVLSITSALADAGLGPEAIDCINAHGTGTLKNDIAETRALKQALGQRVFKIPITANKSMTGHLIAASGAVEAVASVLTLFTGTVPPTINLSNPDPECDLDYVTEGCRSFSGQTVLSNSFGFGGQNATLIFGKALPLGAPASLPALSGTPASLSAPPGALAPLPASSQPHHINREPLVERQKKEETGENTGSPKRSRQDAGAPE